MLPNVDFTFTFLDILQVDHNFVKFQYVLNVWDVNSLQSHQRTKSDLVIHNIQPLCLFVLNLLVSPNETVIDKYLLG